MDENSCHREVILVTDRILAASLFVLGHVSVFTFRNEYNGKFYGVFPISKRLREDIKRYYTPGLVINAKMIGDELDEIAMSEAEYLAYIESKLKDDAAAARG